MAEHLFGTAVNPLDNYSMEGDTPAITVEHGEPVDWELINFLMRQYGRVIFINRAFTSKVQL